MAEFGVRKLGAVLEILKSFGADCNNGLNEWCSFFGSIFRGVGSAARHGIVASCDVILQTTYMVRSKELQSTIPLSALASLVRIPNTQARYPEKPC